MAKKKYRKQRQHTRKLKTGKRILVNPGTFYTVVKKKANLSQNKRDVLRGLDKYSFEIGGNLDFNKEDLEYSTQHYGGESYVDIEINPDFEVQYHTHPVVGQPFLDYINHIPSDMDVYALKDQDNQSSIIIHDGNMFIMTRTKKFNNMSKGELRRKTQKVEEILKKKAMEHFIKKSPPQKFVNDVKKDYNSLGLDISFIPKSKRGKVDIPIKVVERVKGRTRQSSNLPVPNVLSVYDSSITQFMNIGDVTSARLVNEQRKDYIKSKGKS